MNNNFVRYDKFSFFRSFRLRKNFASCIRIVVSGARRRRRVFSTMIGRHVSKIALKLQYILFFLFEANEERIFGNRQRKIRHYFLFFFLINRFNFLVLLRKLLSVSHAIARIV